MAIRNHEFALPLNLEDLTSGFVTQQEINQKPSHINPLLDNFDFGGSPVPEFCTDEEFAEMMAGNFQSWLLPESANIDAGGYLETNPPLYSDNLLNHNPVPQEVLTQEDADRLEIDPRLHVHIPPNHADCVQDSYSDQVEKWSQPTLPPSTAVPRHSVVQAQAGFQPPSPKTTEEVLRQYMAGELVPKVLTKNDLGSRPFRSMPDEAFPQQPVSQRSFNPKHGSSYPPLPGSPVRHEAISPSKGGKRGFNDAFPDGEPTGPESIDASKRTKRSRRQPSPLSQSSRESSTSSFSNEKPMFYTPVIEPQSPPQNTKRVEKNNRPANIRNLDPRKWYRPLAAPHPSWGSLDPITGLHTFQYNMQGELKPGTKFSVEQISEFLEQNPRHWISSPPCYKNSGLTLWIQICPADSGNRYPTTQSSKCRFTNCPVPNNTIRKGEYRVAFDEQSYKDLEPPLDPFHNSGYVHLYCFEKNFDFPYICRTYNVKADCRNFAEGINRMAITRDYPQMKNIVNRFMLTSDLWNGRRPPHWYSQTLCFALTEENLAREPPRRKKIRAVRAGNSIEVHKNNLDLMAANTEKQKRKQKKRRERLTAEIKQARRSAKRRRHTYDEDDEDDNKDDNEDDEVEIRRRRAKKPRASRG